MISMICAMDRNRLIGNDNALPWHLPRDMAHFKAATLGRPIIMGRKTFESIGRPLPGRENIVLTSRSTPIEGCKVVHSLHAAICAAGKVEEMVVIGGSQIYELFMPVADRIYLTQVEGEFEGDTHFPEITDEWIERDSQLVEADNANAYAMRFTTLQRRYP